LAKLRACRSRRRAFPLAPETAVEATASPWSIWPCIKQRHSGGQSRASRSSRSHPGSDTLSRPAEPPRCPLPQTAPLFSRSRRPAGHRRRGARRRRRGRRGSSTGQPRSPVEVDDVADRARALFMRHRLSRTRIANRALRGFGLDLLRELCTSGAGRWA
jgi:hypothetical protein